MTSRSAQTMSLRDFERLLEVYGGDRTRWPLAARASAAMRLAGDATARRRLAEAEALDAVLLHAPEPDAADVAALASRIVAAAASAPRTAPVVVPSPTRFELRPRRRYVVDPFLVRTGAVLAASLMIGIFVGQTQLGARALPAIETMAGIGSPAMSDQYAWVDFHVEAPDEE